VLLVSGAACTPEDRQSDEDAVDRAFRERQSGIVVEVSGTVTRQLADDVDGSRHQRFVIELQSGHTLLISHNIDLAVRVPVKVGDHVYVRGRYEWNDKGGVVHRTHHDPQGRRPGGWIRHHKRSYR